MPGALLNFYLSDIYYKGGDLKKAKFHGEAAAMAGNEAARYNLGMIEARSGNLGRAIKHWTIAASAGDFGAMHQLRAIFEAGALSRDEIDSSLTAYNDCCVEMRSEARDAYLREYINDIGAG